MGYHRPIGTWEECWDCKGLGVREIKCYECEHIQSLAEQCSYCDGVGFTLRKNWVREDGDPPPLTPGQLREVFVDEMSKNLVPLGRFRFEIDPKDWRGVQGSRGT